MNDGWRFGIWCDLISRCQNSWRNTVMCRQNLRRNLIFLLAGNMLLAGPVPVNAQGSAPVDLPALVVLVRHADKASEPSDDPPLTSKGTRRARELAKTLQNARLSAIITTDFRRTRDTALPIAAATGLTPEVVPIKGRRLDSHLQALEATLRRHAGGAVLVVGHDSTITPLIAALGGPRLPHIGAMEYDNLFILVAAAAKIHLVHSRYGAASPVLEQDSR